MGPPFVKGGQGVGCLNRPLEMNFRARDLGLIDLPCLNILAN